MDDEESTDEDRSAQVRGALLKALATVVGIGVVIALGTTIVVHALGLNQGDSSGPVGASPTGPARHQLPTTALPVPGEDTQAAAPSATPAAGSGKAGQIVLEVSPVIASPMERVNLTGTYKGADNLGLEVQRFDGGAWSNFGVTATVRVGTYATYVMTGRSGDQHFRMFDPAAKRGSNVVLVTIN